MSAYSNATQTIPVVFQEIIKNDARRRELADRGFATFAEVEEYKRLMRDKANLRAGAEKALRAT